MSNDDAARDLARWLDQPKGSRPPVDLDPELVEAMYALRPDLAPPLRLTADDILATVTAGPLAGSGAAQAPSTAAGGELVSFPSRPTPPSQPQDAVAEGRSTPVRRGRFWVFAGGTGSVGLALVAAATILLVALPAIRSEEAASPAAAEPTTVETERRSSPASSISPARDAAVAESAAAVDARASREAAPGASPSTENSAPLSAPTPAPSAVAQAPSDEVFEMGEMSRMRQNTLIPELDQAIGGEGEAVAALDDAEAPAAVQAGAASSKRTQERTDDAGSVDFDTTSVDIDALRARALPRDRSSSTWRRGVDGDALGTFDAAIAAADSARASGNLQAAGDLLSAAVQPPGRAGQHLAALAATDYLAAGLASAAAGVAQRGLGLDSRNTAERAWLHVLYGDALRAMGDDIGARDAYLQADAGNSAR